MAKKDYQGNEIPDDAVPIQTETLLTTEEPPTFKNDKGIVIDRETGLPHADRTQPEERYNAAQPANEEFTDGHFKKKSDSEIYALKIHESVRDGITHSAKNVAHFWQGTKDQFETLFTSV